MQFNAKSEGRLYITYWTRHNDILLRIFFRIYVDSVTNFFYKLNTLISIQYLQFTYQCNYFKFLLPLSLINLNNFFFFWLVEKAAEINTMAKISIVRFSTEVAPQKFIPMPKCSLTKKLDTINEEEAYVSTISSSLDRKLERDRYLGGCILGF